MSLKTNLDTATISSPIAEQNLPSMGWPYKKAYPAMTGAVRIKPFSFNTHAILVTNLSAGQKFIEIIKLVAEFSDPSFDPSNLLISDQQFIMAIARSLTFGEQFSFQSFCPNPDCRHVGSETVKIPDMLPIKWWNFESEVAFKNHLTLTLPTAKDKVKISYKTYKEENDISSMALAAEKASPDEAEFPGRLQWIYGVASKIETVNNSSPTFDEARGYIQRIVGDDYDALNQAIEDKRCGIDYVYTVSCDKCGTIFQADVPLQSSFFRRS